MHALLFIIILAVLAIVFGGGLLFLTSKVGPKRTLSEAKMMPYECGIRGEEKADSKISVKFYLTAILFILFDIEIIFMYPWALVYRDFLQHGPLIFIEMMVFMAILVFGLFYVWKARALEWD